MFIQLFFSECNYINGVQVIYEECYESAGVMVYFPISDFIFDEVFAFYL